MNRNIGSYLLTILIAFVLGACSNRSQPEPVSFEIEFSEYAFTPNTIEVKVGQEVTLNLVNKGIISHEIMFGRDLQYEGVLPKSYKIDMFVNSGVEPKIIGGGTGEDQPHMHDDAGIMVVLPKQGERASITFLVTEKMVGEWEMGCFEQSGIHYNAGMVGKFIVKP